MCPVWLEHSEPERAWHERGERGGVGQIIDYMRLCSHGSEWTRGKVTGSYDDDDDDDDDNKDQVDNSLPVQQFRKRSFSFPKCFVPNQPMNLVCCNDSFQFHFCYVLFCL